MGEGGGQRGCATSLHGQVPPPSSLSALSCWLRGLSAGFRLSSFSQNFLARSCAHTLYLCE